MSEIIASTYEIIGKIGSGGGGIVYLANHMRLGKKVVLKADKRKLSTKPEILRREVDALKNLSHAYIPQVYDFFVEDGTVYTVMDYIEGESLDKPLIRGERISQPKLILWACQLLEALAYLHSPVHGTPPRGIVHSDIKPANIMVTPLGNVCLIDFNIALALGEENVVGKSAGYSSPEHYGLDFSSKTPSAEDATELMTQTGDAKDEPVSEHSSSGNRIVIPDSRSDIYSLGATLYHLLSGVKPAKDATMVEPLSRSEFSPLLVDIISKAMNPNPDLRYQSAGEMLHDLTHLRQNDPRAKRQKRGAKIVSSVLALTFAAGLFTSFVGLKRMEMTQKSLTLAQYSQNALAKGDTMQAIRYALEALPTEKGIFVPKHTSSAKKALADSLGIYDLDDGFKNHRVLELPSETFKTAISPDGKTGAAVYSFAVAVFDTESGKITDTLPTVKSALADVVFADNQTIIYAGREGLCAYDIEDKKNLWTGKSATSIALSADGKTVAGIYRDENFATVYDIDGTEKATIFFKDRKQFVVDDDTFADPNDNLFVISGDGKYLAVSFEDGGLFIYDISASEEYIEIYDQSGYTHFEGGFSGRYFAFSSTMAESSAFAVIDVAELSQTGGFELDDRIGVVANESGIYISNKSTVVKIHPVTGEQEEVAYADSDVTSFSTDTLSTIVATEKNDYVLYDKFANLTEQYDGGQTKCNFVNISGDYGLVAGMDTPKVRILKRKTFGDSDIFNYDPDYIHDEARFSEDGKTVMLFNYEGFRLYGKDGTLIKEAEIPDAKKVYDQQYSKKSGNLVVIYKDALRIYSGVSGEIIFEQTDLKSVFYAPYGVSILDKENNLKLIDKDTADVIVSKKVKGDNAAYCGMVVDSKFTGKGELIGATKKGSKYFFAIKTDDICSVFDNKGKKLFEIPVSEQSEAYFTNDTIVLSPLHGTPRVYRLTDGKKIADLEKDSYLAYITEVKDYVISDYISASGERFAIMLDKNTYEPVATLPGLCDVNGEELIFDYYKGKLREKQIYSTEEMIEYAKSCT
ncbi:MAG: hypothetical protein E7394_06725 [Ruminococcaceae bacterium]|nr:hypothetical protein [Oscillospiraceae bacterium]